MPFPTTAFYKMGRSLNGDDSRPSSFNKIMAMRVSERERETRAASVSLSATTKLPYALPLDWLS
jgi:hypothetical protein